MHYEEENCTPLQYNVDNDLLRDMNVKQEQNIRRMIAILLNQG